MIGLGRLVAMVIVLCLPIGSASVAHAELLVIPPPKRALIPIDTALVRWNLTKADLDELGPTELLTKVRIKEQKAEFEKAAETDPVAALLLGLSMIPQHSSLGLEPDVIEAFHWISVAAQSNYPRMLATLAFIHDSGYGVPKSEVEAAKLYRLAADQGDMRSMFNLSIAYSFGRGLKADDVEALKWARAAAAKGHHRAMYNVGYAYFDGTGGVAQSYPDAMQWFLKAAAGGAPKAMSMIGYMYDEGLSVTKDVTVAQEWYQKAAAKGDKAAIARLAELSEKK